MIIKETQDKIQEVVNRIKEANNDITQVLPLWQQIKELDFIGTYGTMYLDLFNNLINSIDSKSMQLVDIWNVANIEIQRQNPALLEKVLDLIENSPEKSLEVWRSTPINRQIIERPKVIENILKRTLETSNAEKFKIFQGVFVCGENVIRNIDISLTCEALRIFSKDDVYLALSTYNYISEENKEEAKNAIDMSLLSNGLQKELEKDFEIEDDVTSLISLYDEIYKAKDLGINVEEYKRGIESKLKSNPRASMEALQDYGYYNARKFNTTIIEMLGEVQESGKDISRYQNSYKLSMSELKKLLEARGDRGIPQGIKIELFINNLSEFSSDILESVKESINSFNLGTEDSYNTYSFEDLEASKAVIDELLKDVKLGDKNDPKRELKIFEQIIKKLGRRIKYNSKAIRKEDKIKRLQKKADKDKISEAEKEKISVKIATLDAEIGSLHIRDIVGGLVYGKAVCAGYAEVVKNVFACVGIESRKIGGIPEKSKSGHAWNQIKIDGKWYNLDLTWDRELLMLGCPARWLLKSDKEFKNHEKFIPYAHQKIEKCETSIKKKDINKYVIHGFKNMKGIFKKPDKIKTWLKDSLKSISIKDIDEALEKLANDVSQEKDNDKEER